MQIKSQKSDEFFGSLHFKGNKSPKNQRKIILLSGVVVEKKHIVVNLSHAYRNS